MSHGIQGLDAPSGAFVPAPLSRRGFLRCSAVLASSSAIGPAVRAAETVAAGLAPRSIHPYPASVMWREGLLRLKGRARLALGGEPAPDLVALMKAMWPRFALDGVALEVVRDSKLRTGEMVLGSGRPPARGAEDAYALAADGSGVGIAASGPESLRHAWYTLLQLLQPADDGAVGIPAVEIHDAPAVAFRGLHLCVFHETTPAMIEKAIRLAAFLKFTHVVLEFWGMLRLDSLKELSWPGAWSKREAGRLVEAARGMGMEVIPMFNSWGHATACRNKYGRHVVLDQNPALAPLFEPDGWTWCLTHPRTQALLRSVADELVEFAGPGGYFHIGCDEAYSHATCDRCRATDRVKLFADHVNGIAEHIASRGRRAIMWGDPLLERGKWPAGFSANGTPDLPTHLAIDRISKKIVIADWHYGVTKGDVPTLALFKEKGFDTLACPWNLAGNIRTLARGAKANGSGYLMTTWHHLAQSIPLLPLVAACTWSKNETAPDLRQMEGSLVRATTASLLRKLVPAEGRFDRAGWNPFEQPLETD